MTLIENINRARELAGMKPLSEAQKLMLEGEDLYKIELDFDPTEELGIDLHSLHADPSKLNNNKKKPVDENEEQRVTRIAKEFAEQHGCTSKFIKLDGPGGGAPVVLFTGPKSKLLALYTTYLGGDTENAELEFPEFSEKV